MLCVYDHNKHLHMDDGVAGGACVMYCDGK